MIAYSSTKQIRTGLVDVNELRMRANSMPSDHADETKGQVEAALARVNRR
jgi:hypothetical protein